MSVVRWKLKDMTTNEQVVLPINPREATAPTAARNLQNGGARWGGDRMRVFDSPSDNPTSWSFGGIIRSESHYMLLLQWTYRESLVRVTDHLGRTFETIIQNFDPVETLPTKTNPWRATYTMTVLLLEEIL